MQTVERFDVSELGKPKRTPQGFLRIPAFLTRAGVFTYKRADGTVVRELRPPEEVFKADSLASLSAAPVTDLHPKEMVSPKNVRQLSVGHVSDDVRQDGRMVSAEVTVEHEDAIAAVDRGERREISCGYRCRIDATPGTYDGVAYDVVQRDIVYNHAALGPRNWGRAGADVALRLDAGGAVTTDAFPFNTEQRNDSHTGDPNMDVTTIKLDGLDIQVPKQWAQVVEKGIGSRDGQIATLTKERDTLTGRVDSLTKELEEAKKKLAAAEDPKRLDAAIAERVVLETSARKVLGGDTKFDGQTKRQIQEAVVKKVDDKFDAANKSDDYVQARFDHAVAAAPADTAAGNGGLGNARSTAVGTTPTPRHDAHDPKPYVPPWQQPLAVTKG